MRRKDFAAALMGVANAVQHDGMALEQARAKMGDIAAAGFREPGDMEQVIGAVGSVEPEPAREAEEQD